MKEKRSKRLTELQLKKSDLSDTEIVEKALLLAPPVMRKQDLRTGTYYWYLEESTRAVPYTTYGRALYERFKQAIDLAAKEAGGLARLEQWGFPAMPETMRKMAVATLRRENGTPRRTGWKWSAESRARLSAARTGTKTPERRRGYPLFTLDESFTLPATGHRFTITRETLAEIRAMIFPEGM